jgi:hypothetical protein
MGKFFLLPPFQEANRLVRDLVVGRDDADGRLLGLGPERVGAGLEGFGIGIFLLIGTFISIFHSKFHLFLSIFQLVAKLASF